MKKFVKPAPAQKPKLYLKFSDLGQLPENEASIALDLLAQCGNEHFLRCEAESKGWQVTWHWRLS